PPPDGLPRKLDLVEGPEGGQLPPQPLEDEPAFAIPLEALGWCCLAVYALCSTLLLARWLLGYVALARLLRAAEAPAAAVARLFAEMTAARKQRARLLVSRRLRVPVSCGLWRPTVVIPVALCDPAAVQQLRWVFAHELTHLERRDAWSCLLFALG